MEAIAHMNGAMRSLVLAACLASTACSSWRPVARFDGWTLYSERGHEVDARSFEAAVAPAIRTVEEALGPFERPIRVHAWNGEAGDGLFGPPGGIFLAAPECGTVAHELVHARAAEEGLDLPLWLEEGVACILGDGFQDGNRWIVDGLACWPLRELQSQQIPDDELARLLALRAGDASSPRQNVLAHFVGWAIVFDLYREAGRIDWTALRARYATAIPLAEARVRLARTVDPACAIEWMARLKDPRREVRLATAKGVWKLRSTEIASALVDAIEHEEDPEVKVGMGINLLACAGEVRFPDVLSGRLWRAVWPALRNTTLADPAEQEGVGDLMRSFRRRGNRSSQGPLETLRRFWAE